MANAISVFCYPSGSMKKPSSGRKGDHEVVEGARVTFILDIRHCNALSLSRLRRQLPPGGSLGQYKPICSQTDGILLVVFN